MKKKLLYTCCATIMLFIAGCEQNGDDGYYDDQYRIYFPKDSAIYTLGDKPIDVETYVVKVPVKILGLPAHDGMKFTVKVDERLSTAPVGSYAGIPEEMVFPKDSVDAYIPVELIRSQITSEKDTVFRLVLELQANKDFQLGIEESLRTSILFGNYLSKPDWWMGFEFYCIGNYDPLKYQKLIEIWGGPVTLDDYFKKNVKLTNACREMYDYFQEHPEYGMVFPENIKWPYE